MLKAVAERMNNAHRQLRNGGDYNRPGDGEEEGTGSGAMRRAGQNPTDVEVGGCVCGDDDGVNLTHIMHARGYSL